MEAIEKARTLYIRSQSDGSLTDEDKAPDKAELQRFIYIGIKEVPSQKLFKHPLILEVLKQALKIQQYEACDATPVAKAFESLEQYFLLLVRQPWKPEYKTIKTYGGFFRTKIRSVLQDCEVIFQKAGYEMSSDRTVMLLKGSINKMLLLILAFDCKVALEVCSTIGEHYKKIKSFKTFGEVVSDILHDGMSRDKLNKNVGLKQGNHHILDSSTNSNVILPPPALPKREPIKNGRNVIPPNIQHPVQGTYANANLNMVESKFKAEMNLPPKVGPPGYEIFGLSAAKSPLTPSTVTPEAFAYIDAATEEILPELPQGTCEEHMRESLKLVEQTPPPSVSQDGIPKTDDWKWFRNMQENGTVPPANQSRLPTRNLNASNSLPLAGMTAGYMPIKPGASILEDEGIEQDMSGTIRYSQYGSTGPHIVPRSSLPPSSGYRTGNHFSNSHVSHSNGMQNAQIYLPPNISDVSGSSLSRPPAAPRTMGPTPPPIPSRSLKPRTPLEDDMTDGAMGLSGSDCSKIRQPVIVKTQAYNGVMGGLPKSFAGIVGAPQSSNSEPILRRDRVMGKSNSLKYGAEGYTAAQQLAQNRAAKSMDMTLSPSISCVHCTFLNPAVNTRCEMCSAVLPE